MDKCGEEVEKKTSVCFNLADDKIKLIDIIPEEDDDFLVLTDSLQDCFFSDDIGEYGGFRLSISSEYEKCQQVKPHRPSFLRRSLAWDSAFLNSAGVLDHDELSFINKGFRTTDHNKANLPFPTDHHLDVRKRRSEQESTIMPSNGCGSSSSSLDWFDIQPFGNDNTSTLDQSGLKLRGSQNRQAIRKVDKSIINKKSERSSTPTGRSINYRTISSPKPPRARTNTLSKSNNCSLPGKSSYVKMENRSSAGKTSSGGPIFSCIASTASVPGKSVDVSSSRASTRKMSKHPASLSHEINHVIISPKQCSTTPQLASGRPRSVGSFSTKKYRPSELRPPSPNIRFFDENITPPSFHHERTTKKMPEKVLSSDPNIMRRCTNPSPCNKKLVRSTPCLEAAKKAKRPKTTNHTNSEKPKTTTPNHIMNNDAVTRPRGTSEKRNGTSSLLNTNKRCKESTFHMSKSNGRNLYTCSVDQVGNLSKYFETLGLNEERQANCDDQKKKKGTTGAENRGSRLVNSCIIKQDKERGAAADALSTRTPLADKTSLRNMSRN